MDENTGRLFSQRELFRMAHDANGNAYLLKSIPPAKRRKQMDDNMHLMAGMEFEKGFPKLKPYTGTTDFHLVAYSDRKNCPSQLAALHFFLDDYRFRNAVWYNLERTTYSISGFSHMFTPDLSLWCNLQTEYYNLKNIYRTRFVGAYWSLCGFHVIPTASWGGLQSFSYCFLGLPSKSIIAVSAMGVRKNAAAFDLWLYGLNRLILEKSPILLLIYGEEFDIPQITTPVKFLSTFVTKHFRNEKSK